MQEHELESFLEQYPDIIEEGLQIVERQKELETELVILIYYAKIRMANM